MRLSTVDDCIAYFNDHGLKPLDGSTCDSTLSLPELVPLVRGMAFRFLCLLRMFYL